MKMFSRSFAKYLIFPFSDQAAQERNKQHIILREKSTAFYQMSLHIIDVGAKLQAGGKAHREKHLEGWVPNGMPCASLIPCWAVSELTGKLCGPQWLR